MKVYYDKSTNGEILFFIGALICLIVSCGLNEWFNVLFAVGWIPILLIIICFFRRRKYYIKRENNFIIFTRKIKVQKITKLELKSIEIDSIIKYYIEHQKLYILTKDNTYILDDFHVKLSKIEKLFLKS